MKKILYTILGIVGLAICLPVSVYAITGFSSWQLTGVTTDVVGNCFKVASGFAITSGSCGAGGGSSGGTFSTTTSNVPGQFTNFPNNTTDIVTIGSSATTTAPIFLDPNIKLVRVNGSIGTTSLPVNFINTNNLTVNNTSVLGTVSSGLWNGTTITVPFGGTGQTSFTSGNLLYGAGTGAIQNVATGTVLSSGGITVTAGQSIIGSGLTVGCTTATGSVPGCISAADWTTFNGKQAAGNYITALTGDVTGSGPGSTAATLATVNGNVGSFGGVNSIPSFTVNGKGLITAASGNTPSIPASEVTTGTFGAGNYTFPSTVTIPNASTTNFSASYASSTAAYFGTLNLPNITGTQCLHSISGVVSGTGSDCGSGSGGAAYPFQVAGNATSTLTQFNGGLTAYASSTIGNGLGNGGLTVNGTATTSTLCLGTDCRSAWPSAGGGAYPFTVTTPDTGNATTTKVQFNGGLTAYASSTIGSGSGTGLTVSGNEVVGGTIAATGNITTTQNTSSGASISVINNGTGITGGALLKATNDSGHVAIHQISASTYLTNGQLSADQFQLTNDTGVGGVLIGELNGNAPIKFTTDKNTLDAIIASTTGHNFGVGTSSPYAKLSVAGRGVFDGDIRADYFTSTSTTVASTFPYASTTAISSSNLTSGNCVQAGTGGLLTTTGSACGAGGSGAPYPFQLTGNATSTLTQFNGGLTAYASSTIGGGAQASGLTVNGGATTTGNLQVGTGASSAFTVSSNGNVGIGTSTPQYPLQIITASANSMDIQDTSSADLSQASFFLENDRGNLTSYGGNFYGSSGFISSDLFGLDRADRYFVTSGGASNAGMAIGTISNTPLTLGTNNTARAVLDSGGNFGVATTSPYKLLSVGGDVVVGAATAGGTLGDLYLPKLGTAAGTFLAADASGKVIATTTPSGSGTNYFSIVGAGIQTNTGSSVGINRVPKIAALDVQGTTTDTNGFSLMASNNATIPIPELAVDNCGFVGIGTTTNPAANCHSGVVDIYSTTTDANLFFSIQGVGAHSATSVLQRNTYGQIHIGTNTGGIEVMGLSAGNRTGLTLTGTQGASSFNKSVPSILLKATGQSGATQGLQTGDSTCVQTANLSTFIQTVMCNGSLGMGSTTPFGFLGTVTGSSTQNLVVMSTTSGQTLFQIDSKGNQYSSSLDTPTISSCGSGATIFAGSNNNAGRFQVGSTALQTSCTITFADGGFVANPNGFVNAPACDANIEGGLTIFTAASSTQTTLLITSAATFTSDFVTYQCRGF